tara:strand:- start:305 stop:556 length:252 start_codon:yes stop_codon:yes gene_type:complete
MNSKVFFNGEITTLSFDEIKSLIFSHGSFSGSIDAGDTMFLFSNVKSEEFDYYVDTFNKQINNQPEEEVTFDIRTDAIETINI